MKKCTGKKRFGKIQDVQGYLDILWFEDHLQQRRGIILTRPDFPRSDRLIEPFILASWDQLGSRANFGVVVTVASSHLSLVSCLSSI